MSYGLASVAGVAIIVGLRKKRAAQSTVFETLLVGWRWDCGAGGYGG